MTASVAVVPSLTIYAIDPRLRVVPLPSLPPRRLAAVTLRGRCLSRSALDLINLVAGGSPAHTTNP